MFGHPPLRFFGGISKSGQKSFETLKYRAAGTLDTLSRNIATNRPSPCRQGHERSPEVFRRQLLAAGTPISGSFLALRDVPGTSRERSYEIFAYEPDQRKKT